MLLQETHSLRRALTPFPPLHSPQSTPRAKKFIISMWICAKTTHIANCVDIYLLLKYIQVHLLMEITSKSVIAVYTQAHVGIILFAAY